MQTNKAVIPLVLAGLATGAAALYILGTGNGKRLWKNGWGSSRNNANNLESHINGHYNNRSYHKKHPVEDIENAIL